MGDITHEPDSGDAARHAGVIAEEYDIARQYGRMSSPAERRRAFAVLFISLVCMGAGQSVIYTILPPAARTLDMDAFKVFCIFAVSALIWVFSSTYWGARSDRWGRKPVMLLGLVAFSISFLAFATTMLGGLKHWLPVAFVFPLLIASRCIYGTFGSGTSAAAQAYVDGPIVARIKANAALSDLQIRVFDVRARQSEITHAPVPGLATRMAAE
jgi:predicted MFS family arabinose efflux permease